MNTKLVMLFTSGDGCTYSCDNVLPFLHESPEAAICELDDAVRNALDRYVKNHRDGDGFTFAGHNLAASVFCHDGKYYAPMILTIDEWFAQEAR